MFGDSPYTNGDVVWVKLGSSWWPGEVCGPSRNPEDSDNIKKKPFAIVKFFHEESFEYVKTANSIHPYNCSKKLEFIKRGLELWKAKYKFMEKFPADIETAERLTDGDISIIENINSSSAKSRQHVVLPEPKPATVSPKVKEPPKNETVTKVIDIRASSSDSTLKSPITQGQYKCPLCSFTSVRQNLIIMHSKSHQTSTQSLSPSPSSNSSKSSLFEASVNYSTNSSPTVQTPKSQSQIKAQSQLKTQSQQKTPSQLKTPPQPKPPTQLKTQSQLKAQSMPRAQIKLQKCSQTKSVRAPVPRPQTPGPQPDAMRGISPSEQDSVIVIDDDSEPDIIHYSVAANRPAAKRSILKKPRFPLPFRVSPKEVVVRQRTEHKSFAFTPKFEPIDEALLPLQLPDISPSPSGSNNNPFELKEKLLADWSDEDQISTGSVEVIELTDDDQCALTIPKTEYVPEVAVQAPEESINHDNDVVIDLINNDEDSETVSTQETFVDSNKSNEEDEKLSTQKIRNIPKKDRRDIVLKEFSGDENQTNAVPPADNSEKQRKDDSIEIVSHCLESESSSKLDKSETIQNTNISVDSHKNESSPIVSYPDSSENIETEKEEITKTCSPSLKKDDVKQDQLKAIQTEYSCFDFEDEEEDDGDVLSSISKYKKKFMSPEKVQDDANKIEPSKNNERSDLEIQDKVLSIDIENLLDSTQVTSLKLGNAPKPSTSYQEGAGQLFQEVRALPIKVRGKRIFKSRNRSRLDETSTVSTSTHVQSSVPDNSNINQSNNVSIAATVSSIASKDDFDITSTTSTVQFENDKTIVNNNTLVPIATEANVPSSSVETLDIEKESESKTTKIIDNIKEQTEISEDREFSENNEPQKVVNELPEILQVDTENIIESSNIPLNNEHELTDCKIDDSDVMKDLELPKKNQNEELGSESHNLSMCQSICEQSDDSDFPEITRADSTSKLLECTELPEAAASQTSIEEIEANNIENKEHKENYELPKSKESDETTFGLDSFENIVREDSNQLDETTNVSDNTETEKDAVSNCEETSKDQANEKIFTTRESDKPEVVEYQNIISKTETLDVCNNSDDHVDVSTIKDTKVLLENSEDLYQFEVLLPNSKVDLNNTSDENKNEEFLEKTENKNPEREAALIVYQDSCKNTADSELDLEKNHMKNTVGDEDLIYVVQLSSVEKNTVSQECSLESQNDTENKPNQSVDPIKDLSESISGVNTCKEAEDYELSKQADNNDLPDSIEIRATSIASNVDEYEENISQDIENQECVVAFKVIEEISGDLELTHGISSEDQVESQQIEENSQQNLLVEGSLDEDISEKDAKNIENKSGTNLNEIQELQKDEISSATCVENSNITDTVDQQSNNQNEKSTVVKQNADLLIGTTEDQPQNNEIDDGNLDRHSVHDEKEIIPCDDNHIDCSQINEDNELSKKDDNYEKPESTTNEIENNCSQISSVDDYLEEPGVIRSFTPNSDDIPLSKLRKVTTNTLSPNSSVKVAQEQDVTSSDIKDDIETAKESNDNDIKSPKSEIFDPISYFQQSVLDGRDEPRRRPIRGCREDTMLKEAITRSLRDESRRRRKTRDSAEIDSLLIEECFIKSGQHSKRRSGGKTKTQIKDVCPSTDIHIVELQNENKNNLVDLERNNKTSPVASNKSNLSIDIPVINSASLRNKIHPIQKSELNKSIDSEFSESKEKISPNRQKRSAPVKELGSPIDETDINKSRKTKNARKVQESNENMADDSSCSRKLRNARSKTKDDLSYAEMSSEHDESNSPENSKKHQKSKKNRRQSQMLSFNEDPTICEYVNDTSTLEITINANSDSTLKTDVDKTTEKNLCSPSSITKMTMRKRSASRNVSETENNFENELKILCTSKASKHNTTKLSPTKKKKYLKKEDDEEKDIEFQEIILQSKNALSLLSANVSERLQTQPSNEVCISLANHNTSLAVEDMPNKSNMSTIDVSNLVDNKKDSFDSVETKIDLPLTSNNNEIEQTENEPVEKELVKLNVVHDEKSAVEQFKENEDLKEQMPTSTKTECDILQLSTILCEESQIPNSENDNSDNFTTTTISTTDDTNNEQNFQEPSQNLSTSINKGNNYDSDLSKNLGTDNVPNELIRRKRRSHLKVTPRKRLIPNISGLPIGVPVSSNQSTNINDALIIDQDNDVIMTNVENQICANVDTTPIVSESTPTKMDIPKIKINIPETKPIIKTALETQLNSPDMFDTEASPAYTPIRALSPHASPAYSPITVQDKSSNLKSTQLTESSAVSPEISPNNSLITQNDSTPKFKKAIQFNEPAKLTIQNYLKNPNILDEPRRVQRKRSGEIISLPNKSISIKVTDNAETSKKVIKMSEIRSFRLKQKNSPNDETAINQTAQTEYIQYLADRHISVTSKDDRASPAIKNKIKLHESAPTTDMQDQVEKVQINVDANNPLSSQIASFLSQNELRTQKKRKQTFEDDIPSFVIEKPSVKKSNEPFRHQLKIIKRTPTPAPKELQKIITTTVGNLGGLKFTRDSVSSPQAQYLVASPTTNKSEDRIFDINNMPILFNEAMMHENPSGNVHLVITPKTVKQSDRFVPTHTVVNKTKNTVVQKFPTTISTPPAKVQQHKVPSPIVRNKRSVANNQESFAKQSFKNIHQTPEKSNPNLVNNSSNCGGKQIGVDNKGNKFVIIKSGKNTKMIITPDSSGDIVRKPLDSVEAALAAAGVSTVRFKRGQNEQTSMVSSTIMNKKDLGTPSATTSQYFSPNGQLLHTNTAGGLIITNKSTTSGAVSSPTSANKKGSGVTITPLFDTTGQVLKQVGRHGAMINQTFIQKIPVNQPGKLKQKASMQSIPKGQNSSLNNSGIIIHQQIPQTIIPGGLRIKQKSGQTAGGNIVIHSNPVMQKVIKQKPNLIAHQQQKTQQQIIQQFLQQHQQQQQQQQLVQLQIHPILMQQNTESQQQIIQQQIQAQEQQQFQIQEEQLKEQQMQQQLQEEQLQQQLHEQQLQEQRLQEQQLKELQLQEQQLQEQHLKEQQLKEQQLQEQLLKEQELQEQQLQEQTMREEQLREEQMREQQLKDQEQERQLHELQIRGQQMLEQQLREDQLQGVNKKLQQQQQNQQQLIPRAKRGRPPKTSMKTSITSALSNTVTNHNQQTNFSISSPSSTIGYQTDETPNNQYSDGSCLVALKGENNINIQSPSLLISPEQHSLEFNQVTTITDETVADNNNAVPPEEPNPSVESGTILDDNTMKILAVPATPVAGYAQTFILCTVVDNKYTPLDNKPMYLEENSDRLVPISTDLYDPNILPNLMLLEQYPNVNDCPRTSGSDEQQVIESDNFQQQNIQDIAITEQDQMQMQQHLQPINEIVTNGENITEQANIMPQSDIRPPIVIIIENQQLILDYPNLMALVESGKVGDTKVLTDDSHEFLFTSDMINALASYYFANEGSQPGQQVFVQAENLLLSNTSTDILAAAMCDSEVYPQEQLLSNEEDVPIDAAVNVEPVETSNIVEQVVYQSPPGKKKALTNETHVTMQTPIMSTLEMPSNKTNIVEDDPVENESLASVIGIGQQSKLPITITNPDISTKTTVVPIISPSGIYTTAGAREISTSLSSIGQEQDLQYELFIQDNNSAAGSTDKIDSIENANNSGEKNAINEYQEIVSGTQYEDPSR